MTRFTIVATAALKELNHKAISMIEGLPGDSGIVAAPLNSIKLNKISGTKQDANIPGHKENVGAVGYMVAERALSQILAHSANQLMMAVDKR